MRWAHRHRRRGTALRSSPVRDGEGSHQAVKRDHSRACSTTATAGSLPEGLLNYLALLGWGYSGDTDVFTLGQMVEAFDVADVNSTPHASDEEG